MGNISLVSHILQLIENNIYFKYEKQLNKNESSKNESNKNESNESRVILLTNCIDLA